MDHIDALELSWKQSESLIAGLRHNQLDAPSPCAGWDLRGVLNHTLGEAMMMTDVNRARSGSNDCGDLVGEGANLIETWRGTGRDNVASWLESGLGGERVYFYGTFPAQAAVLINLGEVVVHSWDLARASGQDFDVDPELAALVHQFYSSVPLEGMRANGVLGPEIPVAGDAPIAERLLGLLGRRP